MSRLLSLPIGFLPPIFVFFVPGVLHLSFFTRALRLSISVVAIIGFYLPFFGSDRGAAIGLLAATISTTVWYLLGDPYGIDNIYIALLTPPVAMLVESSLTRMAVGASARRKAGSDGLGAAPNPSLPRAEGSGDAPGYR